MYYNDIMQIYVSSFSQYRRVLLQRLSSTLYNRTGVLKKPVKHMHPARMGKKQKTKWAFVKYIYELNTNVNLCVLPALRKFNTFKNKINLSKAQDN